MRTERQTRGPVAPKPVDNSIATKAFPGAAVTIVPVEPVEDLDHSTLDSPTFLFGTSFVPPLSSSSPRSSFGAGSLQPFSERLRHRMDEIRSAAADMSSRPPTTPQVISPSPSPRGSFSSTSGAYTGPVTRSAGRSRVSSPPPITEDGTPSKSRSRSRTSGETRRRRTSGAARKTGDGTVPAINGAVNGHLKPPGAEGPFSYWRELSRSPSPLGLIPAHREFRRFVHKHEIPRKSLHVSIGFLVLYLYTHGYQPTQITPFLLTALVPITAADLLRHRSPAFNHFYIRVLGALMRESEVANYNGTIFFLAGTYFVLRVFPKDVGVLGVILLSWCDTAASTVGRLWGRHTPRIRPGKSVAGTAAAMATGVAAAAFFWGYVAPRLGAPFGFDVGANAFAFRGVLRLPASVCGFLGLDAESAKVTGKWAVGIASAVAGAVAAAAEAVDLFGWDDNLTIPVLCGVGLWGFLKTFG